jgi:hypothetical protein
MFQAMLPSILIVVFALLVLAFIVLVLFLRNEPPKPPAPQVEPYVEYWDPGYEVGDTQREVLIHGDPTLEDRGSYELMGYMN